MNKKSMTWIFGAVLTVFMSVCAAGCGNDDTPGQPFDPSRPYRPVNKLSQVFKNGYLKKRTIFATSYLGGNDGVDVVTEEPIEEEYFVDENNNLVKVVENDKDRALFEYGYFTDPMGNGYHVRYTYINNSGEATVSLCKLNGDEMVEEIYFSGGTGRRYEYQEGHIVRITDYKVVDGQKVDDGRATTYEWNKTSLTKYGSWELKYPGTQNRAAFFSVLLPDLFPGTERYLYMAALMGQPSRYLPCEYYESYHGSDTYKVTDWKYQENGLPQSVKVNHNHIGGSHGDITYYQVEYKWR